MYPAKTSAGFNTVKQLMADGHTIEEIQGQFLPLQPTPRRRG